MSETKRSQGPASLDGSRVLVIGASSGMGADVARHLRRLGATVLAAGRSSRRLQPLVDEDPDHTEAIELDITQRDAAIETLNGLQLDHVVLTSAALTYKPFAELTIDDARAIFDSKLWGYWTVVQTLTPRLPDHGSFVLFSGMATDRPSPGAAAVTAVNAAIEGLVRAAAIEIGPKRINAISPAIVDTPSYAEMAQDDRERLFAAEAAATPTGALTTTTQIADAVAFLLGNGQINGTVLHVDGGRPLS